MGEVEGLTAAVVRELSGQEPNIRRPLRAGGSVVPRHRPAEPRRVPHAAPEHPDRKAVGGCGGAYWWHSPEDTLDKADARVLADDTRIYATLAARLILPPLYPYNFVRSAQDFITHLAALQEAGGEHLDLAPTIAAAERLRDCAAELAALPPARPRQAIPRLNGAMLALTRILNPALFTIDGPYEMDPALQLPVLPGLAPLRDLAALDPASDDYRFLLTRLRRQQNRVRRAAPRGCSTPSSRPPRPGISPGRDRPRPLPTARRGSATGAGPRP